MENEVWVKLDEYNYSISNLGRVKNNKTDYILKGSINDKGYKVLSLYNDGERYDFRVHQLVAMAFLKHVPCGYESIINHVNGIKTDNSVENLEIVTQRANASICFKVNKENYSSQYVGVCWNKRRKLWQSTIRIYKKRYFLGCFIDEKDAGEIYNEALNNLENNTFNEWYLTLDKKVKTSKYKGVSFSKERNKWHSEITINSKRKNLGFFKSEEEAYKEYLKYKLEHGTNN